MIFPRSLGVEPVERWRVSAPARRISSATTAADCTVLRITSRGPLGRHEIDQALPIQGPLATAVSDPLALLELRRPVNSALD